MDSLSFENDNIKMMMTKSDGETDHRLLIRMGVFQQLEHMSHAKKLFIGIR